jgi:ribonuclease P protein component
MLSKSRRISKADFPYILAQGRRFNSEHLLLYSAPMKNTAEPSRFSFSISKKVAAKASDRNRQRRRGYASLHNLLPFLKTGSFSFFSFKKGGHAIPAAVIGSEARKLLLEAGVLL